MFGEAECIIVASDATIGDVRRAAIAAGMPATSGLSFGGAELRDDQLVADSGVTAEATLHVEACRPVFEDADCLSVSPDGQRVTVSCADGFAQVPITAAIGEMGHTVKFTVSNASAAKTSLRLKIAGAGTDWQSSAQGMMKEGDVVESIIDFESNTWRFSIGDTMFTPRKLDAGITASSLQFVMVVGACDEFTFQMI